MAEGFPPCGLLSPNAINQIIADNKNPEETTSRSLLVRRTRRPVGGYYKRRRMRRRRIDTRRCGAPENSPQTL